MNPVEGPAGPIRRRASMRAAGVLFRFYRAGLSPLLGPCCRFEPTCSCYVEEAIGRFGWMRGMWLGVWRLLRCHPFARGGLDPVPSLAPASPRGEPITAGFSGGRSRTPAEG